MIYNTKQPHRGRNMNGRTPYAVFKAGIPERPHRRGPGVSRLPSFYTPVNRLARIEGCRRVVRSRSSVA